MVGQLWSDAGKKIDEFVEALNALRRDVSSILELDATLVLVEKIQSRFFDWHHGNEHGDQILKHMEPKYNILVSL